MFVVTLIGMSKSNSFIMPENPADFAAMGIDQNIGLLVMLIPFAIGLLFLFLSVRKIHKRSGISLLTSREKFSGSRFIFSAIIWGGFMFLSLLIHLIAEPGNYLFQPDWRALLPLFLVTIVFIPLQAGFEEAFFRGYLMQAFGLLFKYRWVAILITGIGFGLLHSSNTEVKAYGFWLTMPEYVGLGLFFGLLAILDEGLELAAGIHIINNIFLSLFVTNDNSSLQTAALVHIQNMNPVLDLMELYLCMVLFIIIAFRKYKWMNWKENLFGKITSDSQNRDLIVNDHANSQNNISNS